MKLTALRVISAGVVLGASLSAMAQERGGGLELERGLKELSMWGNLTTGDDNSLWLWLSGDLGFMVSDAHELGPTLNVQLGISSWSSWGTHAWGSCGGFYRYNIPTRSNDLLPFAGARATWFLGDEQEWDFETRVETGVRYVIGKSMSASLTLFSSRRFRSGCGSGACFHDDSRSGFALGVSTFF